MFFLIKINRWSNSLEVVSHEQILQGVLLELGLFLSIFLKDMAWRKEDRCHFWDLSYVC